MGHSTLIESNRLLRRPFFQNKLVHRTVTCAVTVLGLAIASSFYFLVLFGSSFENKIQQSLRFFPQIGTAADEDQYKMSVLGSSFVEKTRQENVTKNLLAAVRSLEGVAL